MKYRAAIFLFAILVILAFSLQTDFAQGVTRPTESSPKKFSVVPYLRDENCNPVEVKAVSNGARPPEVFTALVTIKSFSDKPVKAVKLRWDVYDWGIGNRKRTAACDAAPEPAEIHLSGTTPLIEVGQLLKGEVYNISSNPEMTSPFHASKTIMVERPIIAWDELKSLTTDGTRETFKDDYLGLMYVVEIQFSDGTRWEAVKK